GRTELIHGAVWGPQIAPSGEQIAIQIEAPTDGLPSEQPQALDNGVWLIDRAGAQPSLLQASEPISVDGTLIESARQYAPRAWSPDGTQLLMGVYFPVGEGGYLAVKELASKDVTEINQACCEAAWNADGTAV